MDQGLVTGVPQPWQFVANQGGVNLFNGASTYAEPLPFPSVPNGSGPEVRITYSSATADTANKTTKDHIDPADGWTFDVPHISQGVSITLRTQQNWDPWSDWLEQADNQFKLDLDGVSYNLILQASTGQKDEYVTETYAPLRIVHCWVASCDGLGATDSLASFDLHHQGDSNDDFSLCDTSYIRYVGLDYWQVRQPDGTRYAFGLTLPSINAVNDMRSQGVLYIEDWYLSRVYAIGSTGGLTTTWTADYSYTNNGNQRTGASGTLNGQQCRGKGYQTTYPSTLASIVYGNSQSVGAPNYYTATFGLAANWTITMSSPVSAIKRYTWTSISSTVDSWTSAGWVALPATRFEYQNGLLSAIDNGYGGRTEYVYGEGTDHRNTTTSKYTKYHYVTQRTARAGGGDPANDTVETYSYGTPCFNDYGAACFFGHDDLFAGLRGGLTGYTQTIQTVASVAAGTLAITQHNMSVNKKTLGQELQIRHKDATGAVLKAEQTDYLTNGSPVTLPAGAWFAAPQTVTTYLIGDIGSSPFTRMTYGYDSHGLPIDIYEYGLDTGSGDKRSTHRYYAANTDKWIIGDLSWENVYTGVVANVGGAALVQQSALYYDGCTAYGCQPTRGSLTRVDGLVNGVWVPQQQAAYDSFGNPVVITDANGNASHTYYNPTGMFVVSTTNALAQVTRYDYFGLNGNGPQDGYGATYGLLKSTTDPNGAITEYRYDPFGRLASVIRPGDTVTLPTRTTTYSDPQPGYLHATYPFEAPTGVSDWGYWGAGVSYVADPGQGQGGSQAMKIVATTTSNWVGHGFSNWQGGKTYYASAWARGSGTLKMRVADRYLGRDTTIASVTLSAAWQHISASYLLPADARELLVLLEPGIGTLWVDNFSIDSAPVKTEVWDREVSGCAGCVRPTFAFYDGLGRAIQTRAETKDGTEQQVVNTTYDALGRAVWSSVPVTESFSWDFSRAAGWDMRPGATTQYDALGRTVRVVSPDGTSSSMLYDGARTLAVDANGHLKTSTSDGLGRLTQVQETLAAYEDRFDTFSQTQWLIDTRYTGLDNGMLRSMSPDMYTYAQSTRPTTLDPAVQPIGVKVEFTTTALPTWSFDGLMEVNTPPGRWPTYLSVTTAGGTINVDWNPQGGDWNQPTSSKRQYLLPAQPNTVYVAVIRASAGTVGSVAVWQRDNPAIRATYEFTLVNGTKYQFITSVQNGTKWIDNYSEFGYQTTRYNYDALDDLTQVTDALTHTTSMAYDSLGRKTAMADADMGQWSYNYDPNGNLTTQTDANGQTLWFGYDPLNRVTQKRLNNSTGALQASYRYDAQPNGIGQRTFMSNTNASAGWQYDLRGRMTTYTTTIQGINNGKAFSTSYGYDAMDRVVTMIYPTGEVVQTGYNAASQPVSLVGVGTDAYVSSVVYNALGQVRTFNYGNNTTTTYSYYGDGYAGPNSYRLGRLTTTKTCQNTLLDITYAYDNVGNVTHRNNISAGTDWYFGYDSLDRIISETIPTPYTFGYDAIGNLTTKAGVAISHSDALHPHAATAISTGEQYSHDANGNMTQRTLGSNWWTMSWDVDKKLSRNAYYTNNGQTLQDWTNYYRDADGNLTYKVTPTSTVAHVGNYFEYNATTRVSTTYYYFGSQLVAMRVVTATGGNTLTYLQGDQLGSTSLTTDPAGNSRGLAYYSVWGGVNTVTGGMATDRLYNGKRQDASASIYDYGARFYYPTIGQFISADTIVPRPEDPQSFNRYAYARNSPISRLDPTGHIDIGALVLGIGDQFFDDYSLGGWSALNVDVKARFQTEDSVDYSAGRVTGQTLALLAGGAEIGGGVGTIGGSLGLSGACLAVTAGACIPLAAGVSAAGVVGGAAMVGHGGLVAAKVLSNGDPMTKLYAQISGPGKWERSTESMSAQAADYQGSVTGRPGEVYRVNGTKFDGYQNGTLLDAKGPGYARFVKEGRFRPWFEGAAKMVRQARDQLRAANGVPITWHVAEQEAYDAIHNLFRDEGISGINLTHTP